MNENNYIKKLNKKINTKWFTELNFRAEKGVYICDAIHHGTGYHINFFLRIYTPYSYNTLHCKTSIFYYFNIVQKTHKLLKGLVFNLIARNYKLLLELLMLVIVFTIFKVCL